MQRNCSTLLHTIVKLSIELSYGCDMPDSILASLWVGKTSHLVWLFRVSHSHSNICLNVSSNWPASIELSLSMHEQKITETSLIKERKISVPTAFQRQHKEESRVWIVSFFFLVQMDVIQALPIVFLSVVNIAEMDEGEVSHQEDSRTLSYVDFLFVYSKSFQIS